METEKCKILLSSWEPDIHADQTDSMISFTTFNILSNYIDAGICHIHL